jgi:hypothetical protein
MEEWKGEKTQLAEFKKKMFLVDFSEVRGDWIVDFVHFAQA